MKRTVLYLLLGFLSFQGLAFTTARDGNVIGSEQKSLPNWDIKIYPNPNNGVFSLMITGSSAALDVLVFNIIGEKVFELQIIGDHGAKLDLSNLQKGLYVIQVIDRNKSEIVTRRINIE